MTGEDGLLRRLLGDTGKVLGLKVTSALLNYGTILALAHWLTTADYGLFGAIMSAMTFGGVLFGLGSRVSIVRFLSEYGAQGRHDLVWGAVGYAERTVLAACVAGGAAIALLAGLGALSGALDVPWVVISAALLILPGFTLLELQSGILRSHGAMALALAPKDLVWRGAVLLAAFAASVLVMPEARLVPVLLGSGTAVTLCWLVQRHLMMRKLIAMVPDRAAPRTEPARWRATSLTIWVTQMARASFGTLDVLIVSALLPLEDVGRYFVLTRTADMVIFLIGSVNLASSPLIARHFAAQDRMAVRQVHAFVALTVSALALSAFLVCVVAGDLVLGVFGPQFVTAQAALIVLMAGQVVCAIMGTGETLTMTGHERTNAVLLIVMAPVSMGMVALLTPAFGLVGAALGSAGGLALWSVLAWLAVRRLTGFDPSLFAAVPRLLRSLPALRRV